MKRNARQATTLAFVFACSSLEACSSATNVSVQNVDLVNYQTLATSGSIVQHTADIHYGIVYGYGKIYVTNFLSNSVDVYNASTKAYVTTLEGNNLSGPCGIAVGGGRIYVANFFPDGSGNSDISQFNASTNAALSTGIRLFYLAKSFYIAYL